VHSELDTGSCRYPALRGITYFLRDCLNERIRKEKPSPLRRLGKGCFCCELLHAPPPFREGPCVQRQRWVLWLFSSRCLLNYSCGTAPDSACDARTTGFPHYAPRFQVLGRLDRSSIRLWLEYSIGEMGCQIAYALLLQHLSQRKEMGEAERPQLSRPGSWRRRSLLAVFSRRRTPQQTRESVRQDRLNRFSGLMFWNVRSEIILYVPLPYSCVISSAVRLTCAFTTIWPRLILPSSSVMAPSSARSCTAF
jgi:hypothetical protein